MRNLLPVDRYITLPGGTRLNDEMETWRLRRRAQWDRDHQDHIQFRRVMLSWHPRNPLSKPFMPLSGNIIHTLRLSSTPSKRKPHNRKAPDQPRTASPTSEIRTPKLSLSLSVPPQKPLPKPFHPQSYHRKHTLRLSYTPMNPHCTAECTTLSDPLTRLNLFRCDTIHPSIVSEGQNAVSPYVATRLQKLQRKHFNVPYVSATTPTPYSISAQSYSFLGAQTPPTPAHAPARARM